MSAILQTKAQILLTEIDPTVEIKFHVIVQYLKRTQIRMRSKQRNKKRSKKEKVPQLRKWLATFIEKCIWIGTNEPSYDDKSGQYVPK